MLVMKTYEAETISGYCSACNQHLTFHVRMVRFHHDDLPTDKRVVDRITDYGPCPKAASAMRRGNPTMLEIEGCPMAAAASKFATVKIASPADRSLDDESNDA